MDCELQSDRTEVINDLEWKKGEENKRSENCWN